MFEPGSKVDLTYYESGIQIRSPGWVIQDYDNGLLKVVREPSAYENMSLEEGGHKPEQKEIAVFNLRSIGFLKVEFVE